MAILNRIFGHEGIKEALRGCKSIQADKAQKEYIEKSAHRWIRPKSFTLDIFTLDQKRSVI